MENYQDLVTDIVCEILEEKQYSGIGAFIDMLNDKKAEDARIARENARRAEVERKNHALDKLYPKGINGAIKNLQDIGKDKKDDKEDNKDGK